MRAIHRARLDEVSPAVILTRETAVRSGRNITVAPITSTVHGLLSEVAVGAANGLDHASVTNCDDVATIGPDELLDHIGFLSDADEQLLLTALLRTFDLTRAPRRAP